VVEEVHVQWSVEQAFEHVLDAVAEGLGERFALGQIVRADENGEPGQRLPPQPPIGEGSGDELQQTRLTRTRRTGDHQALRSLHRFLPDTR
jgi:hypothetical protein